jgi:hypothetical protein
MEAVARGTPLRKECTSVGRIEKMNVTMITLLLHLQIDQRIR